MNFSVDSFLDVKQMVTKEKVMDIWGDSFM